MKKSIIKTTVQNVEMTFEEIIQKLADNQAERKGLLQAIQSKISRKTEGGFYFKDDNANVPKYWFKVASDNEGDLLPRSFDLPDFGIKALSFEQIVDVKNEDDKVAVELKTVRDDISIDTYAYCAFVIKRVKEKESDPVFKKILQNAPVFRAARKKAESSTETPAVKE